MGMTINKLSYRSVPTFRNYEDYHDAEQYTKGWNDAMDYIFPESKKAREREAARKKYKLLDPGRRDKYDYDGSSEDFCEAYDMAVEIMRKYQKIQEIVKQKDYDRFNSHNYYGYFLRVQDIGKVLQYGKID